MVACGTTAGDQGPHGIIQQAALNRIGRVEVRTKANRRLAPFPQPLATTLATGAMLPVQGSCLPGVCPAAVCGSQHAKAVSGTPQMLHPPHMHAHVCRQGATPLPTAPLA